MSTVTTVTTTYPSNRDQIVTNNENWQYTIDSGIFERIPTSQSVRIVHVSIASPKRIWGLDDTGQIFKLIYSPTDSRWIHFPVAGDIRFIDISSSKEGDLYGINRADHLLYRVQDRELASKWGKVVMTHERPEHVFEQVLKNDTQRLIQVTATSHYSVYGLNEAGQVVFLNIPRFSKKLFRWQLFAGDVNFRKIAVGGAHMFRKTELWALDAQTDTPMRWLWSSGSWETFSEPLLDISVTLDNAVYGVRKQDGRLVKWNGAEQFIVQDQPMSSTGINREATKTYRQLTHVAALEEGKYVFGLDATTGELLRMLM